VWATKSSFHPAKSLVFTDEDGDAKATKRKILFTGSKGGANPRIMRFTPFVFGKDGKMYFKMGTRAEDIRDQRMASRLWIWMATP